METFLLCSAVVVVAVGVAALRRSLNRALYLIERDVNDLRRRIESLKESTCRSRDHLLESVIQLGEEDQAIKDYLGIKWKYTPGTRKLVKTAKPKSRSGSSNE